MGKRVRRLSVFLLVAVAALSVQVGLLCRVCKASEPSEEVVARIKKFFSIIDNDGKEFLFPEDAANLDLSDITVGNGYKRYRLEGERLEDSNLVNYPICSGGRPFAICITKYNDSGVEEVVQAGSIRSEPYYGEDIDYSDVTIVVEMRKRRSFYLISGPYIWHYEGGALVSKGETGRVGHEDSRCWPRRGPRYAPTRSPSASTSLPELVTLSLQRRTAGLVYEMTSNFLKNLMTTS